MNLFEYLSKLISYFVAMVFVLFCVWQVFATVSAGLVAIVCVFALFSIKLFVY